MASGTTVGIRELKNQLSRFVARVRRGQEVTVTDRGAAVAKLVPLTSDHRAMDRLIAEGLVEPAPGRRTRRTRGPRVRLRGRGPTLGAYVVDQRR
ncbi:MAG: type II toxin-antitoxin system Phd/YefM family antitoxin [Candidatus Binatia bacterium]